MKKNVTIILLLLISFAVSAQSIDKKLDKTMQLFADAGQFSGTVLVSQKGKVIFEKSYGLANQEWKIPNTIDTKFLIGSVTKQFTSLLVLQLVQEGKIDLNKSIRTYLTDYPEKNGNKISIHHLLTHTAGIPNYTEIPSFSQNMTVKNIKPEDFIKDYTGLDLEFEPGTKWNYSNTGYYILGVLIEKVTGKSYAKNLEERIFTPLKMTNSGLADNSTIYPKMADGYNYSFGEWTRAGYVNLSQVYAAGGIFSTVHDLLTWENSLWSNQLISKEMTEKMFAKYANAMGGYYGYARMTAKFKTATMKDSLTFNEHGGSIPSFNSLLTTIPETQTTIILLRNHLNGPMNTIKMALVQTLNGEKVKAPKKDGVAEFAAKIKSDGMEKALSWLRQIKTEKADEYTVAEDGLNSLGYKFLGDGELNEAIAVFKLNCEFFPRSGNTWDSLGEAYYEAKRFDESKSAYKKSLENDPTNQNAINYLTKMGEKMDTATEVKVDPAVFKTLVGQYQLAPGFILTITTENNQIFAQATGQQKLEIFPKSDYEYYLKVVSAQITFVKDEKGKINQLILHQGGRDMPANRVE